MRVPAARTGSGESVFVIETSARGVTVSVSVMLVLLAAAGSVVPTGSVAEAMLETVPEVAVTEAETVSS